jgi:hypothetical protein
VVIDDQNCHIHSFVRLGDTSNTVTHTLFYG